MRLHRFTEIAGLCSCEGESRKRLILNMLDVAPPLHRQKHDLFLAGWGVWGNPGWTPGGRFLAFGSYLAGGQRPEIPASLINSILRQRREILFKNRSKDLWFARSEDPDLESSTRRCGCCYR
jgi:hypothetical protein